MHSPYSYSLRDSRQAVADTAAAVRSSRESINAIEAGIDRSNRAIDETQRVLHASPSPAVIAHHPPTMAHRLCPVCKKPGRLLPDSSKLASVDYFRCDDCAQVWSHSKGHPDAPANSVTVPPDDPKP